jgi:hypothetical protein
VIHFTGKVQQAVLCLLVLEQIVQDLHVGTAPPSMKKVIFRRVAGTGTPIAFDQPGQGPALILVTGALNTRASSSPGCARRAALQRVRLHRRGRGEDPLSRTNVLSSHYSHQCVIVRRRLIFAALSQYLTDSWRCQRTGLQSRCKCSPSRWEE